MLNIFIMQDKFSQSTYRFHIINRKCKDFENTTCSGNLFCQCLPRRTACNYAQGRSQGGRGENPPPRNRKNCCWKMVVFPKALFLVTNFRKKIKNKNKKIKNSIFLRNFHEKISKFPNNLCFSTKRAKNARIVC